MLMLCYLLPECNPSSSFFFFLIKKACEVSLPFFFFQSCTISASPSRIYVDVPFLLSVSVFSQDQFFSVVFNCFSPDLLFQAHARQAVYL